MIGELVQWGGICHINRGVVAFSDSESDFATFLAFAGALVYIRPGSRMCALKGSAWDFVKLRDPATLSVEALIEGQRQMDWYSRVLQQSASGRITSILRRLAGSELGMSAVGGVVVSINHQQLGFFSRISREGVGRVLKQTPCFRREPAVRHGIFIATEEESSNAKPSKNTIPSWSIPSPF